MSPSSGSPSSVAVAVCSFNASRQAVLPCCACNHGLHPAKWSSFRGAARVTAGGSPRASRRVLGLLVGFVINYPGFQQESPSS
jgi:hypothetical protein